MECVRSVQLREWNSPQSVEIAGNIACRLRPAFRIFTRNAFLPFGCSFFIVGKTVFFSLSSLLAPVRCRRASPPILVEALTHYGVAFELTESDLA